MFTISQVAASTPYDDSISLLGADNVQDAIDLLAGLVSGFASEEYVAAAASNLLPFYLYSDASDVATYLVMKDGVPPGGGFGLNVSGAIDGDLVSAFVSEPGVPGITAIPSGVYKLRAQARQSAGTKTSKIYFEIYKRVLAGTETLLGTSSESDALTGSNAEQICHIVFPSPITFLSTDRIVIKIRVRVSGAGTAPDVTVDIQGVNFSRFEWPASILDAATAYVDATAWKHVGNAGVVNGLMGTTDAQPWTTIVNGIFIDSYGIDGQVSSILNVLQPDSTQFYQKRNQVNLSIAAHTTGISFLNQNNSVEIAGAFNYGGAISGVGAGVNNSSSGIVDFISATENNISLSGGGTTTMVKGVNMNAGVSGANVGYWAGVGSYMNMSAGSTGQGRAFEAGWSIDDSTTTGWDLFGGYLNIFGTTVNTGNVQVLGGGVTLHETSHSDGVNSISLNTEAKDDSTANGMMGMNLNTQAHDNAAISGGVIGFNNTVSIYGASTNTGVTGDLLNLQLQGTSNSGGVSGHYVGVSQQDASVTSSNTALNVNHTFQGTSSTVGATSIGISFQAQNDAVLNNVNGFNLQAQLSNNAAVTNFSPFALSAFVNDAAVVTNGITLMNAQFSSTPNVPSVTGFNLNLTGATVADAMTKTCINAQGGLNLFQYDFTVPPAAGFLAVHQFAANMTITTGAPISSLGFVNNFGCSLVAQDDWTADFTGIRIGWTTYTALAQLDINTGKTIDSFSGVFSALSVVAGTGTIDQAFMFRAAGVFPNGGSPTVNLEVGFQAMPTMGGLSGGNCWAFRDDTSSAENYLGRLAIGTGSKKVSNSDTALEIGDARAFLNGRGTTAQRTALTALAGMQFFDTDLSQLFWYDGAAWVVASGAYTPPTDFQEELAGPYDGVNVSFTMTNTPTSDAAVRLYRNGLLLYQGTDYTLAGAAITMTVAPASDQTLYAVYTY